MKVSKNLISIRRRRIASNEESGTTISDLIKGFSGLDVHDRICLIYETREEQLAAAIPFIRMGLEREEQCVYIIDENTQFWMQCVEMV